MEERLGEMRKGRRERMRKGAIVTSSPQGMTSWSSSIKIWFFLAYRMHYYKTLSRALDPRANGTWLSKLTK